MGLLQSVLCILHHWGVQRLTCTMRCCGARVEGMEAGGGGRLGIYSLPFLLHKVFFFRTLPCLTTVVSLVFRHNIPDSQE